MSVISDAINGAVEVTTGTAELAAAKIYSIAAGVGLLLVLLFLLVLFFMEPVMAMAVTIALILAAVYIVRETDLVG